MKDIVYRNNPHTFLILLQLNEAPFLFLLF